ncbi:MAG: cytochrome c [candidate division NC10 bacterium]
MRRLVKKSHAILLLVGVICFSIAAAQAPDASQGVVKYRQSVMKSHAAHMSAMGRIVQGQVPFTEHVADHAAAIRSTSKMIPQIFPEGSGTGETRAKPDIWQKRSQFEQAALTLQQESAKLVEVAQGGDMKEITVQYLAVAKACKGCHKPFRKRK